VTPTEITGIGGLIVTAIALVVVPYLLRRGDKKKQLDDTEVVSWEKMNAVLQTQNTKLQATQEELDSRYRAKLQRMEDDYTQQLAPAKARITELENTIADLYVELRRLRS